MSVPTGIRAPAASPAARGGLSPRSFGFTILLGVMAALPPLSIDLGLPALPAIGAAFHATADATGQTLSLFMLGFAVAQLVFGPLSDHWGRRPVLLLGCALFSIGGVACAFAGGLEMLLVARAIEGAGAGAGTVLAFAIVRDVFEGEAARAKLSFVSVILSVAPVIAPSAGAILLEASGWRAIYVFLAVVGLALTVAVGLGLRETRRAAPSTGPWASYRALLSDRRMVIPALVNALSFGGMFAYVAGSPSLLLQDYHLPTSLYGVLFACTAGGIMAGAACNGWIFARIRADAPLIAGLIAAAASALALTFLFRASGLPALALIMPLLVVNTFCLGLVSPNATHFALDAQPQRAGVASAIIGFAQMAAGAAAAAVVAALQAPLGPCATAATMAAFGCAALLVWLAGMCFKRPWIEPRDDVAPASPNP